jgi:hypothetical protein
MQLVEHRDDFGLREIAVMCISSLGVIWDPIAIFVDADEASSYCWWSVSTVRQGACSIVLFIAIPQRRWRRGGKEKSQRKWKGKRGEYKVTISPK